ncbi:MAG: DUF2306 domain-containing protein [Flavobacteriia bacterium]|nr:DUF2306 domain-containing protein [Flavobacteriia bacterium]
MKVTLPRLSRNEMTFVLILLIWGLIPSLVGTARIVEMNAGSGSLPTNPRAEETPLPIAIHIVSSIAFSLIGIFQLIPAFGKRFPRAHKNLGRVFIGFSILSGLTGLWMTHFYSFPSGLQGDLLYTARILVGFGMIYCTIIGLLKVMKKRLFSHLSWMIRAYALGLGAGTQAIIGISLAVFGLDLEGFPRDIFMTYSWVINILLAEIVINRYPVPRSWKT